MRRRFPRPRLLSSPGSPGSPGSSTTLAESAPRS